MSEKCFQILSFSVNRGTKALESTTETPSALHKMANYKVFLTFFLLLIEIEIDFDFSF